MTQFTLAVKTGILKHLVSVLDAGGAQIMMSQRVGTIPQKHVLTSAGGEVARVTRRPVFDLSTRSSFNVKMGGRTVATLVKTGRFANGLRIDRLGWVHIGDRVGLNYELVDQSGQVQCRVERLQQKSRLGTLSTLTTMGLASDALCIAVVIGLGIIMDGSNDSNLLDALPSGP